MIGENTILKILGPIVQKKLTDEKVSELFDQLVSNIPLKYGEIKNIVVLSKEKDDKVYFSIWGIKKERSKYLFSECKVQKLLVNSVMDLLSLLNTGKNE